MKTKLTLLSLVLTVGLVAADQPAACCATDAKPKVGCCCTDESTDKVSCCAEKSAAPAACCTEKTKPAACCAQADTPKAAACCPVEEPVAKKPDACCAEIENQKSISHGSGRATDPGRAAARNGKIQNFSAESLYQLEVGFSDDSARPFTLGSLRGRPVVLTMFFASCGYACPLLLTDMQAIRARLPADIRDQAALVLVSFDVARDTPGALAKYRADRHLDAQWTLLHGDDDAVRELAALLGVKFKQEVDGQFAHSNLITVLNGEGEVVHQRNGLRGGLDETALAVVHAVR